MQGKVGQQGPGEKNQHAVSKTVLLLVTKADIWIVTYHVSSLKNPVEGEVLVWSNIGPDCLWTIYGSVTVVQRLPCQAQEGVKTIPSEAHCQIRDFGVNKTGFCNGYQNGSRKLAYLSFSTHASTPTVGTSTSSFKENINFIQYSENIINSERMYTVRR